jgi:uncharacterized membrane protein
MKSLERQLGLMFNAELMFTSMSSCVSYFHIHVHIQQGHILGSGTLSVLHTECGFTQTNMHGKLFCFAVLYTIHLNAKSLLKT